MGGGRGWNWPPSRKGTLKKSNLIRVNIRFTKLILRKRILVHYEELRSVLPRFNREFRATKVFQWSMRAKKILPPSSLRSPIKEVFFSIEQVVLYQHRNVPSLFYTVLLNTLNQIPSHCSPCINFLAEAECPCIVEYFSTWYRLDLFIFHKISFCLFFDLSTQLVWQLHWLKF